MPSAAIAEANFDFADMARTTLGDHWRKITPQQQAQFVPLFTSSWRTSTCASCRNTASPAMGIDFGATLFRAGRYRSRNFLRDEFQRAIAGRPREDHSHRRTDRVFDPALSVDSPTASRPHITLTHFCGEEGRIAS
jgi:hypothetical protein